MMCISSELEIRRKKIIFLLLFRERELKPRFAEPNTIEYTIGLKWKQLELQEKQLLEEVKKRMQFASDQLQVEIDQTLLEHQAQALRDGRRFEDINNDRRIRNKSIRERMNST